jgi:hypothetical protein
MSDTPSPLDNDPGAWSQAALRRQVAVLERLAEAGLELAVAIKDQSSQAAPADIAMAFARVARAVRLTCLLQSKLIKDGDEARREADGERRRQEALAKIDANQARRERKDRVQAIVERVAWTETEDEDRTESLVAEAGERLDTDDIYGDVLTRPMGELVAGVCRDLGLDPDWEGLAREAWAMDERRRGDPASPFLALEVGEDALNPQGSQADQEEQSQGGGQGIRPGVPFHTRQ